MGDGSIWIFGYGSLVWRPGFPHLRSLPATLRGYARRFWQGSTDHRGLPGRPGRVVTLLPDEELQLVSDPPDPATVCWDTAYEIPDADPENVLSGLDHRERGGYRRVDVKISVFQDSRPAEGWRPSDIDVAPSVRGLVYIAGPENANYLGEAPIEEIARQIASASGPSGKNRDYVFELAHRLRALGVMDEHVFAVESAVRRIHGDEPRAFG